MKVMLWILIDQIWLVGLCIHSAFLACIVRVLLIEINQREQLQYISSWNLNGLNPQTAIAKSSVLIIGGTPLRLDYRNSDYN